MTEAERMYEEVTGIKPDSETGLAVGLVLAVEQSGTLLERVKAARAVLAVVRENCAKVAEADTSFDMLQDFGMQSHSAQLRANIAEAIRKG